MLKIYNLKMESGSKIEKYTNKLDIKEVWEQVKMVLENENKSQSICYSNPSKPRPIMPA